MTPGMEATTDARHDPASAPERIAERATDKASELKQVYARPARDPLHLLDLRGGRDQDFLQIFYKGSEEKLL
jgi:hypothetical protein